MAMCHHTSWVETGGSTNAHLRDVWVVPRACDRGAGQVGLRLLTNKENQEQILVTSFVFDDECCQYL